MWAKPGPATYLMWEPPPHPPTSPQRGRQVAPAAESLLGNPKLLPCWGQCVPRPQPPHPPPPLLSTQRWPAGYHTAKPRSQE